MARLEEKTRAPLVATPPLDLHACVALAAYFTFSASEVLVGSPLASPS
jgi:hypothetical protein